MPHRIITGLFAIGFILTFFMQLEGYADDAGTQALDFAKSMNQAIPCATDGRALDECSTIHVPEDTLDSYQQFLNESSDRLQDELTR